jgi:hypothetical protein
MRPLIHWLLQQPLQLIARVNILMHHVDKCGGGGGGERWVRPGAAIMVSSEETDAGEGGKHCSTVRACRCSVGGEHHDVVSCVIVLTLVL